MCYSFLFWQPLILHCDFDGATHGWWVLPHEQHSDFPSLYCSVWQPLTATRTCWWPPTLKRPSHPAPWSRWCTSPRHIGSWWAEGIQVGGWSKWFSRVDEPTWANRDDVREISSVVHVKQPVIDSSRLGKRRLRSSNQHCKGRADPVIPHPEVLK